MTLSELLVLLKNNIKVIGGRVMQDEHVDIDHIVQAEAKASIHIQELGDRHRNIMNSLA